MRDLQLEEIGIESQHLMDEESITVSFPGLTAEKDEEITDMDSELEDESDDSEDVDDEDDDDSSEEDDEPESDLTDEHSK
jgi:hypothetical protein